tara:strand:- start:2376 stop:2549 length:174 start_codon:yes stop_codon:yes gene_type:complete
MIDQLPTILSLIGIVVMLVGAFEISDEIGLIMLGISLIVIGLIASILRILTKPERGR